MDSPIGWRPYVPVEDRFEAMVDRVENRLDRNGDCWLWEGGTNKKDGEGYGTIAMKTGNGRKNAMFYVHRVMYERYVGIIPDGMEIDHLCCVPLCARPSHLEAVTHAENMRRKAVRITHCVVGHPFDSENTSITTEGKRNCRTCDRDAAYAKRGIGGKRRGPNRRWTDGEIALIIASTVTKPLAEKFGVTSSAIQRIRKKHKTM